MHVIADICVLPTTGELSMREPIAHAYEILRESGLPVTLHTWGTNIEGPMDQVLGLVQRIHRELHEQGIPRVTTDFKLSTRIDKEQHMQERVEAVDEVLER